MAAIDAIDEGLWAIRCPHRMVGVEVGTRSTLARLPSGGLLILSPGPWGEDGFEDIEGLGKVEALVAPNTYHHLFFGRAAARYPEAARFLAPGLREKVPSLPTGEVLGEEPPPIWRGALEQKLVRGSDTNEVAFFHPRSRTLILTDLAFNIRSGGLWTRLGMWLNGGFGRFGPTRVLHSTVKDAAAFRASLHAIAAWDFDRILVSHGEIVPSGGRELFRRAFSLGEGAAGIDAAI